MLHGKGFQPPAAAGLFSDVPAESWMAGWVEAAYNDELIEPCQAGSEPRFCPNGPLTRAMAAFMVAKAKNLSIP